MDLSNYKITAADYDGKDIASLPDSISGQADSVKARFDSLTKEVVVPKFNGLIDNINAAIKEAILMVMPPGTVISNTSGINPGEYIGGTWEAWAKGRTLIGVGKVEANTIDSYGSVSAGEIEILDADEKGGEYKHKLTQAEMPAHSHTQTHGSNTTGTAWVGAKGTSEKGTSYTSNTGGDEAHNNIQPYQACYYWRRTA